MFNWNNNNLACITTWITFYYMKQIQKSFADSADVKMNELLYWNNAASASMRTLQADALAANIDNTFTTIRGARYEDGSDQGKAISGMSAVLQDSSKSMTDLAKVNDDNYKFWHEV